MTAWQYLSHRALRSAVSKSEACPRRPWRVVRRAQLEDSGLQEAGTAHGGAPVKRTWAQGLGPGLLCAQLGNRAAVGTDSSPNRAAGATCPAQDISSVFLLPGTCSLSPTPLEGPPGATNAASPRASQPARCSFEPQAEVWPTGCLLTLGTSVDHITGHRPTTHLSLLPVPASGFLL